ncbi:MAG: FtsL-like putative cell division protein [Bacteroidales bacterium]|nr:FtsL-like putative cell division protein [Bacteroidales bacterium]MDD6139822.1 FtsL-like putative cell division protein [Bacteroidales bacterium]MDD6622390.1 FtsL-like putative cell division protein [Bacteroidales bacterium]MDD6670143.1 FtsL-like putative cell division protein [Bacteroidales bacterium]
MAKKNITDNDTEQRHGLWGLIQGEWFSGSAYRRHIFWVLLVVVLFVIYISFKFTAQFQIDEVKKLQQELTNVQTSQIHVTSRYGSQTRESEMIKMVDSLHLELVSPEQPPFNLNNN